MSSSRFSIKDLESLTGIKAHTIRIWEQRYSFLKPGRTASNIRFYSGEEVKSVLNISLLVRQGYKISEIDNMSNAVVTHTVSSLHTAEARKERELNQLIIMMIDMDMQAFESALTKYIDENGIGSALTELVLPFIERIGIFWSERNRNGAEEHIVSNILRQKLLFAIDSHVAENKKNKSIVLFLPEGEHYELGLLYINYLLQQLGLNTLYLGANVPFSDLLSVAKFKTPDYVITHLSSRIPAFEKFLPKYQQQLPQIPLVITYHSFKSIFKKALPDNVIKKNFLEMPRFLESI